MNKKALIVGAGSAGLIAAKELKDKGFNIRIIDKQSAIGGIWKSVAWKGFTLTSSRWVTEYGCYPMPDEYPDFVTREHMLEYLDAFVLKYQLDDDLHFGIELHSVRKLSDRQLEVTTSEGTDVVDYLVITTGLHGKPSTPDFPGLDEFGGPCLHSSDYIDPETLRDERVLCVGLGESGVGLVSELAQVTRELFVSSEGVAVAPRVVKGTQNPFDQMQFWNLGRRMIGYQEVLTSGLSWFYRKIPTPLKRFSVSANLRFYSDYSPGFRTFEPWIPKALVPHHFHVKFWSKPKDCPTSGNLTRPEAPADDIFYLISERLITPKGRVKSFTRDAVLFEDGSRAEIDRVIFNTGFKPGVMAIQFPDEWSYRHSDLYKGCLHNDHPNIAFVGMVRPTIGSIPAMAEMHARLVAAWFSGELPLPGRSARGAEIAKDTQRHRAECPAIHERFPHIYFFDDWMEKMAAVLGVQPDLRTHLSSLDGIRAYFLGAPMPLRFRMNGPGSIPGATETYYARVRKVWGNSFGKWALTTILIHMLTPWVLSLASTGILWSAVGLPLPVALLGGGIFFTAYRYIDLFRYLFETVLARSLSLLAGVFFLKGFKHDTPDYSAPSVFQTLS